MVTLEKIIELGQSLEEENEIRKKKNLKPSDDSSFFNVEEINLGRKVVTWADNDINIFCYQRVQNSQDESCFLCRKEGCKAVTNIISDCDSKDSPFVSLIHDSCVCGQRRPGNTHSRKRTSYYML